MRQFYEPRRFYSIFVIIEIGCLLIFNTVQYLLRLPMSRRQLPVRSTRNQKPEPSGQSREADNAFYDMIFGNVEEASREQERKRQEQKLARKAMMVANLPSHSYARAYHYYFDLKTFPRLQSHPSYALDANNSFGWTFVQDEKDYKGNKLSELINRIYFGLPLTNREERHDDRSKNICHGILFQGEDKKYNVQRALYTCRLIYKNLQTLLEKQKIDQFRYIMKKQPELQILSDVTVSFQKKKELLAKIISEFQQKKEHNKPFHQQEDRHHYYFSLNQKIHNRISSLEGKISLSIVPRTIYTNQINLLDTIKENPENLMAILRQAFTYHQSRTEGVRQQTLKSLLLQYSHVLYLELDDIPVVTLPCQIYSFGSPQLLEIVNRIVSIKIIKLQGQLGFYPAKFAWSKLFKSQLYLEKNILKMTNLEYRNLLQKFVKEVKEFRSVKKDQFDANQYALDEMINFEGFAEQGSSHLFILKRNNSVTINNKELLIIAIYSWLCKAISSIYHILQQNPLYVNLFTSDFYAKYHLYVAEAVGDVYFATFQHAINMLTEHIAASGPMFQFKISLQFDYDPLKRLGIVWKTPKAEDEFSQQQQIEQQEQLQKVGSEQIKQNNANNEQKQKEQDEVEQILGNNPRKQIKQNDDVQQM